MACRWSGCWRPSPPTATCGSCAEADFDGSALDMIQSVEADAMLEATYTDIKTGEPATSHVRAALERGMHVVTTNKGPVALRYRELRQLARRQRRALPVRGHGHERHAGAEPHPRAPWPAAAITEIQGILNGTTNYMLTAMEDGLDYDAALAQAQELGYAEAVPDADVLGWDALAKVTILANVVFGADLEPGDSACEGITGITADLIEKARGAGQRYKLIGRVWREGDRVQASVAPAGSGTCRTRWPASRAPPTPSPSRTDTLGDVTIVGPGAGRRATGYSMLIDLIHLGDKP